MPDYQERSIEQQQQAQAEAQRAQAEQAAMDRDAMAQSLRADQARTTVEPGDQTPQTDAGRVALPEAPRAPADSPPAGGGGGDGGGGDLRELRGPQIDRDQEYRRQAEEQARQRQDE